MDKGLYLVMFTLSSQSKHDSLESGFTLIESLTAILIFAIATFVAVPQFLSLNASVKRLDVRLSVLENLRRAQAEAVTQGCRGIVKVAADFKSYTFGCDYLPYDSVVPPTADNQVFINYMPNLFQITSDDVIIFNSRGQIVDAADILDTRTVTLSDATSGTMTAFATGNINGIGMFDYD